MRMNTNTMGLNSVYNRQYNTNNNSMSRQQQANPVLSNRQDNQNNVSFGLNARNCSAPGILLILLSVAALIADHKLAVSNTARAASNVASTIVTHLADEAGDVCDGVGLLKTEKAIAAQIKAANQPLFGLVQREAHTTYTIRNGEGCKVDVTTGEGENATTFSYNAD